MTVEIEATVEVLTPSFTASMSEHSSPTVTADIILGVAEVDGTATSFSLLTPSASTVAVGDAPVGFDATATIDLATFAAYLESTWPAGITVAVPGGDHPGIYSFDADTVSDAWRRVSGSLVRSFDAAGGLEWTGTRHPTGAIVTTFPQTGADALATAHPLEFVAGAHLAYTLGDNASYYSTTAPAALADCCVEFAVAAILPGGDEYMEFFTIAHAGYADLDLVELAFQSHGDHLHLFSEFTREGDTPGEAGEFRAGDISAADETPQEYDVFDKSAAALPIGHLFHGAWTLVGDNGDDVWEVAYWREVLADPEWTSSNTGKMYRRIFQRSGSGALAISADTADHPWKIGIHDGVMAVEYVHVYDGKDGALLAEFVAADAATPAADITDSEGNVWAANGAAAVVDTTIAGIAALAAGGGGSGVELSSSTPADLGTAAVGVGTTAARADHVHDMPTASDVGADPAGTAAGLVDDLSGVSNQATARTNLGLGTAAMAATGDFATAAQGTDTRTPTDNSVTTAKIVNGAVTAVKLWTPPSGTYVTGGLYSAKFEAGGTRALAAGQICFFQLPLDGACTIDALWIDVATGAASGAGHLYLVQAGATGLPTTTATILATAANVSTVSSGVRVVGVLGTPYVAARGELWGAWHPIVGNPTCRAVSSASQPGPPHVSVYGSASGTSCIYATGAGTSTTPLTTLSGVTFGAPVNQAPVIGWRTA